MSFLKILVLVFLTISSYLDAAKPLESEMISCLKCICEAATSCDDIYICAEKAINLNYWRQAGSPTVKPEDPPGAALSYESCKVDENCILNTMFFYTETILERVNDINCDGIIDCRDRLAAHKFGLLAKEPNNNFQIGHRKRFDRCPGHGKGNLTDTDWNPAICFQPRVNTE